MKMTTRRWRKIALVSALCAPLWAQAQDSSLFSPAYLQAPSKWLSASSLGYQQVNFTASRAGISSPVSRENTVLQQMFQYGLSDGLAVGVAQQYVHNAAYSPDNAPSSEGYANPSVYLNTTAKTQSGVLIIGHFAVAPLASYAAASVGSTSYTASGTAVWHLGATQVLSANVTRTLFNRDDFYANTGESDFTALGATWAKHMGQHLLTFQAQYQLADAKFTNSGPDYSLYDPSATTLYILGISHRVGTGGEWELSYHHTQMNAHVAFSGPAAGPSVDSVLAARMLQLTYRTSF